MTPIALRACAGQVCLLGHTDELESIATDATANPLRASQFAVMSNCFFLLTHSATSDRGEQKFGTLFSQSPLYMPVGEPSVSIGPVQITDAYHAEWQLFELISALFRGLFPLPLFLLPSANNAGAQVKHFVTVGSLSSYSKHFK